MSKNPTYSIIVPVYNGADSLLELIDRTIATFESSGNTLETILLVDDASIDNSWETICSAKSAHPNKVKGLKLSRNFGQHNATCAGILRIESNFIITMDDDLETAPEDIVKLIERQNKSNAKVVYGKHERSNRNIARKFFKFVFQLAAKIVGGDSKVNGSSFRLIETNLAKNIALKATNFVFIDEVIFWYTNQIEFEEIKHHKSRRAKSNYSMSNLFKLGGDVVMYSSMFPLQLIKVFGFFTSLMMFMIGSYFFIKQVFFDIPVQGFAAIMVTITFSMGIIIFILGVIGEYLGKIFRNSNNSPVYSIDAEI